MKELECRMTFLQWLDFMHGVTLARMSGKTVTYKGVNYGYLRPDVPNE